MDSVDERWTTIHGAIEWLAKRGVTKSYGTMIRWCKVHHIGKQVGGRSWVISLVKLEQLLDGETDDKTNGTTAEETSGTS